MAKTWPSYGYEFLTFHIHSQNCSWNVNKNIPLVTGKSEDVETGS